MKLNTTLRTSMLALACSMGISTLAQEKPKRFGKELPLKQCGTVEYEAQLQQNNAQRSNEQFEHWLAPKVAEARVKRMQKDGAGTNDIVTIPVVVHVIHNGSTLGTAENIPDERIFSQITVLNQDFRRMADTNGYNEHPDGADMEIEFCLAQRDPNGLASTGIVRYNMGTGEGWEFAEVEALKAQTQWDPEKYLNIWVFDYIYSGLYELAAYAQFPTESGLEGLDGVPGMPSTASTDGVAAGYRYFGSEEIYPEGNYDSVRRLGRTVSHEVGHYLGLRHTWGDATNCTGTDYCDDTPATNGANSGCPDSLDSCEDSPGLDMVENYMDYTADSCQNVFTNDQKDRMHAVLANSPRRASLATSDGCVPGAVYDNDGSLHINFIETACGESTFIPEIILSNPGNNTLTSAAIEYSVNGGETAVHNWEGSLAQGEEAVITLPELTGVTGENTFDIAISTVNGGEDQAPLNDIRTRKFNLTGTYTTTELTVTIQTDNAGAQIIWMLGGVDAANPIGGNLNSNGTINYYGNNSLNVTTVTVEESECYMFLMYDLGGDGICCANGEGYYKIETADGEIIAEGGEFLSVEQKRFSIDATAGTNEVNAFGTVKLYPNPASSILNIAIPDAANMPESYTIYNSLGQVMGSGKVTTATQAIDIAAYAEGVYFVKLERGNNAQTMQFIKY